MTSYEFPRQSRLLNAEDFRGVFDNVQVKAGNQHFLLLSVSNSLDHPRIGFVFSKKTLSLQCVETSSNDYLENPFVWIVQDYRQLILSYWREKAWMMWIWPRLTKNPIDFGKNWLNDIKNTQTDLFLVERLQTCAVCFLPSSNFINTASVHWWAVTADIIPLVPPTHSKQSNNMVPFEAVFSQLNGYHVVTHFRTAV